MALPCVVLLSDFGSDGAASLVGVCKSVHPELPVYELTHDVPRFDIAAAAKILSDQLLSWPDGTVFVCAVDPRFGTGERVLACRLENGTVVVGPDNGCLDATRRMHRVKELRELAQLNQTYLERESSSVPHGRNLAYCAACIAAKSPALEDAGEVVSPRESGD